LFYPLVLKFIQEGAGVISLSGLWSPSLATVLIVLGVILGFMLFRLSAKTTRVTSSYIGGEVLEDEVKVEDFYATIKELTFLKTIYKKAEQKCFDIYDAGFKFLSLFIKLLRYLHNGVLPTYLVWCLLGLMGLFWVFLK
jgi:hypothetical protein